MDNILPQFTFAKACRDDIYEFQKNITLLQMFLLIILPKRYTFIHFEEEEKKRFFVFKKIINGIFSLKNIYIIRFSRDSILPKLKEKKTTFIYFVIPLFFILLALWNGDLRNRNIILSICTDNQHNIIENGYFPYLCGMESNPTKHFNYIKKREYDNDKIMFYEYFIKKGLPFFDIDGINKVILKQKLHFPLKEFSKEEFNNGYFESSILNYKSYDISGINNELNFRNISFVYLEKYIELYIGGMKENKNICLSSLELGLNRNIIFLNKMENEDSFKEIKKKKLTCYDPKLITEQSLLGTFRAEYFYLFDEEYGNSKIYIERPRTTTIECKNRNNQINQYTLFDFYNIACFHQAYELNNFIFYSKNELIVENFEGDV